MATSGEIKVSVENIISKSIQAFFQEISNTYNLQFEEIHIDWVDVSTSGEVKFKVSNVAMQSSQRYF